jgi:superfamily II DNA or RNA helicase
MAKETEEELQRSEPIHVVLKNRTTYFVGWYPTEAVKEHLRYRPSGYFWSPQYKAFDQTGKRVWDGYKVFLARNSCPTGLFLAQFPAMKAAGLQFVIDDQRKRPKFKFVESSERAFQNDCLSVMRKKSKTGGIILAATASGKTYIAGKFFEALEGTAVFIVDELTLLDQTRKDLMKVLGEKVGYIGNMKFRPRRITVATIQTLYRHRNDPRFIPWIKKLDVAIVDELHKALSKRNLKTIQGYFKPLAVYGLTATLELKKADVRMRANALCGPVIFEYPLEQGTDEGHLSPGIVIGVDIPRKGRGGDYQDDYREMIAQSKKRNQIIEEIVREARRRKKHTCLLVQWVRHLKRMSERLEDIPHRTVFGEKKVKDRIKAKADFDSSKIRLLIANIVFEKGVDIKRIDAIIDGASMAGKNAAKQKFGRGVRLSETKVGLIYFDIGDINDRPRDKYDPLWNRFEKTTRRRRVAFKELGVPVVRYTWDGDVEALFDLAERTLKKWAKKIEIRREKLRKKKAGKR